jgi:Bacteriophage capsid protein
MIDTFVRNVVPSTGIRAVPQTNDPAFNQEMADRFDEWAHTASACGRFGLADLQRIYLKTVLGHGDAGAVFIVGPDGAPKIQGVEADRIATPPDRSRYEDDQIYQGVYVGAGASPLGYYVGRRGRYGVLTPDDWRYIPADYMCHVFDPQNFSHYRGTSRFLPSYNHLRRIQSLMEYKTLAQKMAAVFGLAIKKSTEKATSPLAALGSTSSDTKAGGTRPDIELFSGMGITLRADEDIVPIHAPAPGGDFSTFVRDVCQFVGVGCGLPLEFVLMDWSRATYYGNQMTAADSRRMFANIYRIPRTFSARVYRHVGRWLIDSGRVRVPAGVTTDPLACDWTLPPPIEVDELKAFQAHAARVERNVDTWEAWCRQQGTVFERIVERRKTELETQRAAGLPIVATSQPGVKLLSEINKEPQA